MTPIPTDAELARQSYQSNEKLWTKMHLRMDGPMHDAVRKLAAIDHRALQDQLRHLVGIGIRHEEHRLVREAETADQVADDIERQQKDAVRRALARAANGARGNEYSSEQGKIGL